MCYRIYMCSNSLFQPFVCLFDRFKDRDLLYSLGSRTTLLCQLVKYWILGVYHDSPLPAFNSFIQKQKCWVTGKLCLKHYLLSFCVCMLVKDREHLGDSSQSLADYRDSMANAFSHFSHGTGLVKLFVRHHFLQ